jgi:hypothetical protein
VKRWPRSTIGGAANSAPADHRAGRAAFTSAHSGRNSRARRANSAAQRGVPMSEELGSPDQGTIADKRGAEPSWSYWQSLVLLVIALAAVGGGIWAWRHFVGPKSVGSLVEGSTGQTVSCSKAGLTDYAGSSTNVYECAFGNGVFRCFVRVKGDLYEVTSDVDAAKRAGSAEARQFGC